MAKKPADDKELKLTFYSKDPLRCPVCDASFYREELLSGGGRLIAGPLTDELHRLYEPSAKFGDVFPLAYQATVCPSCWYAAWDADFFALPPDGRQEIAADREARVEDLQAIFPRVDFSNPRGLEEGAAAHYLALRCYDGFPKEFSPTIKQGIIALRGAWLFEDLHRRLPAENYDWLAQLFKRKARYFYREAVAREQSGKEALSGLKNFGPDADKNYGYEGLLYLVALLEYKYGPKEDPALRRDSIGECKRTIAKIFGLGKSSKAKPGPLLEKARDLYDTFNRELDEADE